jgi:hypothetical protein
MGPRNRVGIGLSYRPARLHRLVELIPWNRFLSFLKIEKYRLRLPCYSNYSPFSLASYKADIGKLSPSLKSLPPPPSPAPVATLNGLNDSVLSTLKMICKRICKTCRIFVLMSLSRLIAKRFLFKIDAKKFVQSIGYGCNDLPSFFYILLAPYKPRIV